MEAAQQQPHSAENIDSDKCQKLKRFVIIALLITIGILGYHFYEYFHGKPLPKMPDNVLALSQKLYQEEMTQSPYLYEANLQGKTIAGAYDDRAPKPLFELHEDLLIMNRNSTTALFRQLFNNYELDVNTAEIVTEEHLQEQHEFLRAIMNTRIMKLSMQFLERKSLVSKDYDAQYELLNELWFTPYSRGNNIVGSSSFEHVFMAELRDQKVLGLHNWLYFAEQEQQGHADYKGWIDRLSLGRPQQFILSLRANFHNIRKPYNSIMIGTSPELELSLFTVCFLSTAEEQPCEVQLGPAKLSIMTYSWKWKGKRLIGTAYADIETKT